MPVEVDPDVADLLAGTVADVVRRAVAPAAAVADAAAELPAATVDALRSSGLLALPPEPVTLTVEAARQLASASAAAALRCVAATAAATAGLRGAVAGAFVDGDTGAVTAARTGDCWEITGSATAEWVTGDGAVAFVVVAADGDGVERAFTVDPVAAGVSTGPVRPTTGLRAAGRAPLTLYRVSAPEIGGPAAVAAARSVWLVGLGAIAVGVGRAALEQAAAHLRNRNQFRTPLSRFPALRALVADLDRDLSAAEAVVTAATGDLTRAAGAARTAAQVAVRLTGEAIQLHGGYGYIVDTGVERLFRDALSIRARVLGARSVTGSAVDAVERLLGPV